MKFAFSRVVLAAMVSVFASCATTSYYQGPPGGTGSATIRNLYRSGGEQGFNQNVAAS